MLNALEIWHVYPKDVVTHVPVHVVFMLLVQLLNTCRFVLAIKDLQEIHFLDAHLYYVSFSCHVQ